MRSSASCSLVSRKGPLVRFKGEALVPKSPGAEAQAFFVPKREGEEGYDYGFVFHLEVSYKLASFVLGSVGAMAYTATSLILQFF